MEIPIVVNENEINIAGFANTLDLSVDVGPQGKRGAIIFSGTGIPTTSPITTPVSSAYGTINAFQAGDLYIKIGQPNNGYVYIYTDEPGGAEWIPLLPIAKNIYYGSHSVTFTNGESSTLNIPLSSIIGSGAAPTFDKFKVNATVEMNDTNSYSLSVKTVSIVASNLRIVFNARTISNATTPVISRTNGSVTLNVSIGVIA